MIYDIKRNKRICLLGLFLAVFMCSHAQYSYVSGTDSLEYITDSVLNDTTYKPILLHGPQLNGGYLTWDNKKNTFVYTQPNKRVVKFNYGSLVDIYLGYDELIGLIAKDTGTFGIDSIIKVDYMMLHNKARKDRDTIIITYEDVSPEFDNIMELIIRRGHVSIYDKKMRKHDDVITYRLERVVDQAWRYFYLPGKRRFLMCMDAFGLLDSRNPNPWGFKIILDKDSAKKDTVK